MNSTILITTVKILIVISCTACLFIQAYYCLERYFNYETTATLAVRPTAQASFLSFTFCPDFYSAYKEDKLKEYGMDKNDLQNGFYHNSAKDKSHRMLFEEVSYKLDEMVKFLELGTWTASNSSLEIPVDGTLDPKLAEWSSKPHITHGLCHNLDVKNKAKELGVSYLYVESHTGLYIYLHHDGQFLDYDAKSKVNVKISQN